MDTYTLRYRLQGSDVIHTTSVEAHTERQARQKLRRRMTHPIEFPDEEEVAA